MYVVHEHLARVYAEQRLEEARQARLRRRLVAARRAERKVQAAAARARRLQALVASA